MNTDRNTNVHTGLAVRPYRSGELLDSPADMAYGPEARLLVEGHTVLVTGAGGTIGGELVNQLAQLGAGRIVRVDCDEYALYRAQLERIGAASMDDDDTYLVDVRDYPTLSQVMAETRPALVFHAAAYKHVPTLERMPGAAVLTNILGTDNVMRAAVEHGVRRVVNISTDKAANPSTVLGYSKRLAEMVAAAYAVGSGTRIASVRFGNVLGSRGSFAETMAWQVDAGLPVTITDPGMSRYFMTIPQAAGLVVEAAVLAEAGRTYVLDMGAPVPIVDLVQRYAALAGVPAPELLVTGVRPAEKMAEDLFDVGEEQQPTTHPDITAVAVPGGGADLLDRLGELYMQVREGIPAGEVRKLMVDVLGSATTFAGVAA
jgi:FlaA1/EpsC-like NDP-sugar epimerase